MTESASASYVVRFLEDTLGLSRESLHADDVPSDLVDELTSVMRGNPPPKDSTSTPSIEVRIGEFLSALERSSLDEKGFFVRKARWPDAASLAVCLTHDVDNIERPMEHILRVKDRFKKADFAKAKKGLLSLYDNIELIGEKEGAEGLRSSFYFLSSNYPLDKVKKAARRLEAKGWEIGLHGDFGTHDSEEGMKSAVERLTAGVGIRPLGVREHYLKFDFDKSWDVIEGAGFEYDTTIGNNDRLGFKLGLATPFHPPDAEWRPMHLLELPLSVMDTTLWGYLKKDEKEGFEDVRRLMDEVEKVDGLFTLLWHQEAVRMKGGRVYWRILKELGRRKKTKRGLFVGSGLDVARWWRAREVPLVSHDDCLITLGGRPPKGLRLILKVKAGTRVNIASGATSNSSAGKRKGGGEAKDESEELLISATGPSFRLEIDSGRRPSSE